MFRPSGGGPIRNRGRGGMYGGHGRGTPYSGHGRGRGRGRGRRGGFQKTREPVRKQLVEQIVAMLRQRGAMRSKDIAQSLGFSNKAEINPTLYYMSRQQIAQKDIRRRHLTWSLMSQDGDAYERWAQEQGPQGGTGEEIWDEAMSEDEESDGNEGVLCDRSQDNQGMFDRGKNLVMSFRGTSPQSHDVSLGADRMGFPSCSHGNRSQTATPSLLAPSYFTQDRTSQGKFTPGRVTRTEQMKTAPIPMHPSSTTLDVQSNASQMMAASTEFQQSLMKAMKKHPLATANENQLAEFLHIPKDPIHRCLELIQNRNLVSLVNPAEELWVLTSEGERLLDARQPSLAIPTVKQEVISPTNEISQTAPLPVQSSSSRKGPPLPPHQLMTANPLWQANDAVKNDSIQTTQNMCTNPPKLQPSNENLMPSNHSPLMSMVSVHRKATLGASAKISSPDLFQGDLHRKITPVNLTLSASPALRVMSDVGSTTDMLQHPQEFPSSLMSMKNNEDVSTRESTPVGFTSESSTAIAVPVSTFLAQPQLKESSSQMSKVPRPPHQVEMERTGKVLPPFTVDTAPSPPTLQPLPSNHPMAAIANKLYQVAEGSPSTQSTTMPFQDPKPSLEQLNSGGGLTGLTNESFAMLNKNPVSALMEFAQSRKQQATIELLRMSGPPHRRRFVMAAFIEGRQFPPVEKTSKKEGKTEAADIALRTLISEGAYKGENPQKTTPTVSNVALGIAANVNTQSVVMPSNNNGGPALSNESFAAINKNPVSALMEYAQSRQQQARIEVLGQSGPPHCPKFVMAAYVGTRQFATVTRSSKKEGKTEASEVAIRTLIAEGAYQNTAANTPAAAQMDPSNMTHFDKMAALSHQAFNVLAAKIPENFAGRKVIAAIIIKRSADDMGNVICVGSGNRCITGQQLSLEGNTVNDSHAEIITRRGLLRFLYQQLQTFQSGQSHDLFEVAPSGKLKVKGEISFHLYISTAPCGDGALFSPRDCENSPATAQENSRDHHPTFTSNAQGLLRTKMEGGEGTIPIEPEFEAQTFDGIQRGERLRTMSCTDKICRWNVLGMQGALLSHFLEPIYLESLTLGYLYDHGHLARAVCCRLNRGDPPMVESLPFGYKLNHPWLGRVTMCDPPRETQKTKAFSINWCIGDTTSEVLDGTTGVCQTNVDKTLFSRVRKRALYDVFKETCAKFGYSHLLTAESYNKAKQMATDFQAAKKEMLKKFHDNKCGPWVGKPVEEEMFS